MGRTACTEPQCLYKGDLYFSFTFIQWIVRVTACFFFCWSDPANLWNCEVWTRVKRGMTAYVCCGLLQYDVNSEDCCDDIKKFSLSPKFPEPPGFFFSSRWSLESIWSWDWERLALYFNTTPTPSYRHAVYRDIFTCSCAWTQYFERIIPYPTTFPYGNGMVLHFYQQQESSTTKTVHKVINKGLKTYV